MAIIRREYHFGGRVQGVGFRWTARSKANQLGLSGWVKNEYDGTVTMVVQGSDVRVGALVHHLCSDTYIQVTSMDYIDLPVKNDEKGFGVRGW